MAVYALAVAWIVASDAERPDPLDLARTADGAGLVVSGAVADDETREALVGAIGEVTGAALIIADLEIDPDASPVPDPLDAAAELASRLPPDRN